MKESLATFRKAVNESADLQEKLKGGTDLVELGKENGYDFSQEDVTAAFEELKDSDEELTGFESQLEAESGGSGSGRKLQISHFVKEKHPLLFSLFVFVGCLLGFLVVGVLLYLIFVGVLLLLWLW